MVALAKVFIRVSGAGSTTFTRSQYPTSLPGITLPFERPGQMPGNQSSISRWADSAESDPCTRLNWVSSPKSPRMVPGWPFHRVGATGELAERGNRAGSDHHGRHDRS